jgi:hypothetical protein
MQRLGVGKGDNKLAKILSGEAEHTLGGTAGELRDLLTRVVLGHWVEFGLFNCGLYSNRK